MEGDRPDSIMVGETVTYRSSHIMENCSDSASQTVGQNMYGTTGFSGVFTQFGSNTCSVMTCATLYLKEDILHMLEKV